MPPENGGSFHTCTILLKSAIVYTEPALVALLQLRSEEAFEYLYTHYSGALNGIIFGITNNRAASEDVLQEVFVRIFRKIELYDAGKSRLYTWMAQLARNAAIDWMRKEGHQPAAINQNAPDDVSVAIAGVNQDVSDLRNWVNKLDKAEREVVVLAYLEGNTQEEISQLLQIPLGTVKSRVRSGLKRLRQMMSEA